MIELVAFLGNYGEEYKNTRHNTAWLFEDSVRYLSNLSWQNKFKSEFAVEDYKSLVQKMVDLNILKLRSDSSLPVPENCPSKIYFMKPLTYMNLSGQAVIEACKFYKIPSENVLIVHDEIELALGFLSLKWSGGLGGHNGLRSLKEVFGTPDFWRLRFGVGKPSNGNVADYVLGRFSQDESITLSQVFSVAEELFAKVLTSKDASKLLGEWSKKKVVE